MSSRRYHWSLIPAALGFLHVLYLVPGMVISLGSERCLMGAIRLIEGNGSVRFTGNRSDRSLRVFEPANSLMPALPDFFSAGRIAVVRILAALFFPGFIPGRLP